MEEEKLDVSIALEERAAKKEHEQNDKDERNGLLVTFFVSIFFIGLYLYFSKLESNKDLYIILAAVLIFFVTGLLLIVKFLEKKPCVKIFFWVFVFSFVVVLNVSDFNAEKILYFTSGYLVCGFILYLSRIEFQEETAGLKNKVSILREKNLKKKLRVSYLKNELKKYIK